MTTENNIENKVKEKSTNPLNTSIGGGVGNTGAVNVSGNQNLNGNNYTN